VVICKTELIDGTDTFERLHDIVDSKKTFKYVDESWFLEEIDVVE
jgi:hypothetical protein